MSLRVLEQAQALLKEGRIKKACTSVDAAQEATFKQTVDRSAELDSALKTMLDTISTVTGTAHFVTEQRGIESLPQLDPNAPDASEQKSKRQDLSQFAKLAATKNTAVTFDESGDSLSDDKKGDVSRPLGSDALAPTTDDQKPASAALSSTPGQSQTGA